jgi:cysteine desulfurase
MSRQIYLDYHATTPCDPRVVKAMLPYFTEGFGNPSSSIHRIGQAASDAVERARAQVAELIGCQPGEIVFTGGATESNNLAIFGLARGNATKRKRIVTTTIEHKAVLGPCQELQKQGFDIVRLPVDAVGCVDLDAAHHAITDDTLVVSIQAANNEIGTIQPVAEVAQIAHERGALVHCDAAQAVGKIPVDIGSWGIDLLSISAHKLYGPKGVGALFISGGPRALHIKPLMAGGGQEQELRPGTLNVPGIVGFGEACALCVPQLAEEAQQIAALRNQLENQLMLALANLSRNGAIHNRLPGNSSLTFHGVDAEALIANLPEFALSTGSACTSGALEPSHVLLAIGLSREQAYGTLRVGLGRFTIMEEVKWAAEEIIRTIKRLSLI